MRERDAALRADLDRDLVGRATDAAALDLDASASRCRAPFPNTFDRLVLGALGDDVERAVDDALGGRLLAVDS